MQFQKGRTLQRLHRNTQASEAEFKAAREGYLKAVELDPQGPMAARALYMAGSAELFAGEPREAIRYYSEVIGRYPQDRSYLAKALVKKASAQKDILEPAASRKTLEQLDAAFPEGAPQAQQSAAVKLKQSLALIGRPVPEIRAERWFNAGEEGATPKGLATLIYVWATWCPNCLKEVDLIVDLQARYGPRGLRLIGVTEHTRGQTDEKVQAYLLEHGFTFPNAVDKDGQTARALTATSVPTGVLVDHRGVIRWHGHPAALSDATIEAVLAEKTPAEG